MRNEIATIVTTLKSICFQTIKPDLLLVLADGVSDGSDHEVEYYSKQYPWIELIRLPDRGFDLVGKGVAQVLNYGLGLLERRPSRFLGKVDADVELSPDYFKRLLALFESQPQLGMASGHPFTFEEGKKILERHGDRFPSGTARIYRREYLRQVGNWVNSVGWDTVDILRMRMRKFEIKVVHDLEYHHIRRMGTRNGYIDGMIRDGRNAYLTGYAPWFLIVRAIYNGIHRPYLLRTTCMLAGYFKAMLVRLPRVVNEEEMKFHRHLHRERFLKLHPLQP
jgi:cellulose synthase/poly-beta-1,6-N-acetylglucosamine synthase-like glycosyltransferase